MVRTQNAEDDTKYDYIADYYFFDDLGDATPYPSDAASVKVKKVEYTRVADYMDGYVSMCLPWAFTEAMRPSGADTKCYAYSGVENNVVKFTEITEFPIAAGTPFIMYDKSGADCTPVPAYNEEGTDVVLVAGEQTVDGCGLFGTFNTMKPGAWSNTNLLYKLHVDGTKFVRTKATSDVYPFRIWLKLPSSNEARGREFVPAFVDYDEDVTTSIKDVELQFNDADGSSHIYNLNGQRTGTDAHGILIINGRKVLK